MLRLNGSDGEDQPGGQADPTVGAIVFDVVFSKPVFGFAAGDVLLSGTAGATTATVSGSGTYTVAVTDITVRPIRFRSRWTRCSWSAKLCTTAPHGS